MQNSNAPASINMVLQRGFESGVAVRLYWSTDGSVRLATTEMSNLGQSGTEIFSVSATQITKSLVADGGTGLYLTIGDKKYAMAGGIWNVVADSQKGQLMPGAFVADTIINDASEMIENHRGLSDFQTYLRGYGVKTQKSSLLKILAVTILAFLIVFVAAVALLIFSFRSSTSFK